MTMFSGHAQYAHQVGASMGFPSAMPAMAAPSGPPVFATPDWQDSNVGASIAGGIGGAMPAAASGLALAGGMGAFGAAGRALDPFSMAGRGFAMGSGAGAGSGFAGTMANIGRSFATGGFRAGAGALAGGAAMGVGLAAIPLLAGAAINEVGANVYSGAQDFSQVGSMANQYFGPQFGSGNITRPGGQMAPQQIREMTSMLGEMASQDTLLAMKDMKRLMDQFGQMGSLTGITNAQQFKTQFKQMVEQTKTIAEVMGTSIEEAGQLFGKFRQMGVWRPSDVMGTSVAMTAMGPGGQAAMSGAMQAGAQGAFARGGNLSAGAFTGRRMMMDVNQSVRSGLFSDQDIINLTGGTGGIEGQQMVAQQLTGMVQNMAYTPVGRLSMAGLGEFQDGRFTGRIDQDVLNQFRSGNISINELQRRGMGRTRTRRGAASFTAQQDMLGQNLGAEGGLELMEAQLDAALQKSGLAGMGEDVEQLMIQKLFGVNDARQARTLQQMMRNIGNIREKSMRRMEQTLEDRIRAVDEQRNKSFAGIGQAVSAWYEREVGEPLKEIGRGLAEDVQLITNNFTDNLMGRSNAHQMLMSREQRTQMLNLIGSGQAPVSVGNQFSNMDADARREAIQGSSFLGFSAENWRVGRSQLEVLEDYGLQVDRSGYSFNLFGRKPFGDQSIGGNRYRDSEARVIQNTLRQASIGGASSIFNEDARGIKSRFESTMRDVLDTDLIGETVGMDAAEKMNLMYERFAASEEGKKRLREMSESSGIKNQRLLFNVLSAESGITMLGDAAGALQGQLATRLLSGNMTSEKIEANLSEGVAEMVRGGVAGDGTTLKNLLANPKFGIQLQEWLAGGGEGEAPEVVKRAAQQGNTELQKVLSNMGSGNNRMNPFRREQISKGAALFGAARGGQARKKVALERKKIAERDAAALQGVEGLDAATQERLTNLVGRFGEDFTGSQEAVGDLVSFAEGLSAEQAKRIAGTGTTIGNFVRTTRQSQNLKAGSKAQVMKQLNQAGLGNIIELLPEQDRETVERALSDGKVTEGEIGDLKMFIKDFLKAQGFQDQGGATAKGAVADLTQLLTKYTAENSKFVLAVQETLPNLKNVSPEDLGIILSPTDEVN